MPSFRKRLLLSQSVDSPGSLYHMKKVGDHRNLCSDVSKCFNHAADFLRYGLLHFDDDKLLLYPHNILPRKQLYQHVNLSYRRVNVVMFWALIIKIFNSLLVTSQRNVAPDSIYRLPLSSIGSPIVEIRWSKHHLVFAMRFPVRL